MHEDPLQTAERHLRQIKADTQSLEIRADLDRWRQMAALENERMRANMAPRREASA